MMTMHLRNTRSRQTSVARIIGTSLLAMATTGAAASSPVHSSDLSLTLLEWLELAGHSPQIAVGTWLTSSLVISLAALIWPRIGAESRHPLS